MPNNGDLYIDRVSYTLYQYTNGLWREYGSFAGSYIFSTDLAITGTAGTIVEITQPQMRPSTRTGKVGDVIISGTNGKFAIITELITTTPYYVFNCQIMDGDLKGVAGPAGPQGPSGGLRLGASVSWGVSNVTAVNQLNITETKNATGVVGSAPYLWYFTIRTSSTNDGSTYETQNTFLSPIGLYYTAHVPFSNASSQTQGTFAMEYRATPSHSFKPAISVGSVYVSGNPATATYTLSVVAQQLVIGVN